MDFPFCLSYVLETACFAAQTVDEVGTFASDVVFGGMLFSSCKTGDFA